MIAIKTNKNRYVFPGGSEHFLWDLHCKFEYAIEYTYISGIWTQDLALARQVFYHLNHTLALFALFFRKGLTFFAKGWSRTSVLLPLLPE
jgi:hypothetical protein